MNKVVYAEHSALLQSRSLPGPSDRVECVRVANADRLNGNARIEGARLERYQARTIGASALGKNDYLRKYKIVFVFFLNIYYQVV